MKSITKVVIAASIGLIAATSAAYAGPSAHCQNAPRHETAMERIDLGTRHVASETWLESKKVGRTLVNSSVIAYQVARGDRALFPRETSHREGIALTGHRAKARAEMNAPRHYDPPI